MGTKIEWADEVWNPVSGCEKVSAGCLHCYAETMAKRFPHIHAKPERVGSEYNPAWPHIPQPFSTVVYHPDRLEKPLRWRKPRTVFVPSMGDLFHHDVPDRFRSDVFSVMAEARQHTFIVCTKRAIEMRDYITKLDEVWYTQYLGSGDDPSMRPWPLPNVWLLVSVEDQATADERIPILLDTPAAVHGVSVEPILGAVDLSPWLPNCRPDDCEEYPAGGGLAQGQACASCPGSRKLSWVICGSEAINGRPGRWAHREYFQWLRDQCVAADVPLFLKQMEVSGKLIHMPVLDGRQWDQMPEVRHDG